MSTEREQRVILNALRKNFRSGPLVGVRETQIRANLRPPARADVWISQDVFPVPQESDLRDAVYEVIEASRTEEMAIPLRESVPLSRVDLEWIGPRRRASPEGAQPALSDAEIYHSLCKDVGHSMTIVYCHGGSFYWGSPGFFRAVTTRISKMSRARVVAASYRLAPQDPFPAALLDLFTTWLNLLYPADEARHTSVSPESVVFAGDSAGANLCLALVQTILQMRVVRKTTQVTFNGKVRDVPLPAGVAMLSPCADFSLAFPSWLSNAHIDILGDIQPAMTPRQPLDDVWPSTPPRGDLYCDPSAWPHPLVSPASADDWRGAPPMWFAIGQERCADGVKVVASRAAQHGVPVVFSEYLGLPHIFATMLKTLPQTKNCFQDWVNFCLECVKEKNHIKTGGRTIPMPGTRVDPVRVESLSTLSREDVVAMMEICARKRKPWTGASGKL